MITPAKIINFDKTETNKYKVFDKTEMNNEVLFDKTETNLNQHFMTLNLRDLQPMCFPDKPSFCPVSVPILKQKSATYRCKLLTLIVLETFER